MAVFPAVSSAAVTLGADPAWESRDDDYATGGMLWDLDADGYVDLVVGNGNDMDDEYDAVFYNHRGELEEGAVRLVRLHHHQLPLAQPGVGADGVEPAADDDGRVAVRVTQQRGDHAGGYRFAGELSPGPPSDESRSDGGAAA